MNRMSSQPRQRRRPARSCEECRRRKIKCDRTHPCSHCVATQAQCTYSLYIHKNTDPQVDPRDVPLGLSARSQSLQSHGHCIQDPQAPTIESGNHQKRATAEERGHTLIRNATPKAGSPQRVQTLDKSSASSPIHGLTETGRDILARQLGLKNSQILLNKTRMLRWSHSMGMAQEVHPLIPSLGMCTNYIYSFQQF
jgi:hypothetical protein